MFFLYGIVGQVSVYVGGVVVELFAAGAKVAFSIPVGLELTAVRGDESIAADVELSVFIEKRVDVLLDKCALATASKLFDSFNYIFSTYLDRNTVSSIGVLTRFDDPCFSFAAQVFWQVIEASFHMVGKGDDIIFVDFLFEAVFFYIFE